MKALITSYIKGQSPSRLLFLIGLFLVTIGLLFSKVFISIGQFMLLGSWLIEGQLKEKIIAFSKNKLALSVSLIFIVHLLGLLYTDDFKYGFKDLRIKIPLLLFPLVFSTSRPLNKNEFKALHYLFVLSVFTSTIISLFVLYNSSVQASFNKRDISIFISHIRFSLMICIAFFICLYHIKKETSGGIKWALIIGLIWFPIFLVVLETFTGIVILCLLLAFYILFVLFQQKNTRLSIALALTILSSLTLITIYFMGLRNEFLHSQIKKELPYKKVSKNGEVYSHPAEFVEDSPRQNGYEVYQNVAWLELKSEWNSRSKIPYDSTALNGYPIRHIIFWYLTSKALSKDAEAVQSLSDKEIVAIENGVSNFIYLDKKGIESRFFQAMWEIQEFNSGHDFNGHSIVMRLIFWKTAINIFKNHVVLGVGTGDIKEAFQKQYEKDQTHLNHEWRLRSHNQYLSFAVTFGIIGFSIILFSLLYPIIRQQSFLYIIFMSVLLLSMLNEDTLETQVGVTLFAFFNAFYLFLDGSKREL